MNQELLTKVETIKGFLDEIQFTYESDNVSEDSYSIEFELEEKSILYQVRVTLSGLFIVTYTRLPITIESDKYDGFLRISNLINLNIPIGNFEITEDLESLVFRTSFAGEATDFNKSIFSHLIFYPSFIAGELFTLLSSYEKGLIDLNESLLKIESYFNSDDAEST